MSSKVKNLSIGFLLPFGAYLALNVGTLLVLNLILKYSTFDSHVAFLAYKQDYINIPLWRTAFYIHVFSSSLTLLAGFTQFAPEILKQHKQVHRLIGRIYVWDILLVNFPSGLIMAIYANGGLPSKIAFCLLDCLWFWFTLKAVREVKQGNYASHRDYMTRSYALTFSAVTLRIWKLILVTFSGFDLDTIYRIIAWMGYIPNWLFAEWLIHHRNQPNAQTLLKKTRRLGSPTP